MSFLDKILNAMKLTDDYDEDDFLDDEIDDYEEPRPKKNFFQKKQTESYDDYDMEEDEEPIIRRSVKQPSKTIKTTTSKSGSVSSGAVSSAKTSSKVSPIRTRKNLNDMSVCVVRPVSMEDAREITETLLAKCTVVLNMEGIDLDLAQRIIDFTSGSCYAISGNLQKISNYIFIITPENVDISGDFQDILNGAFDIPPINM
ncbi:MAG: cell division protein SepF [Muricoprocola sp.]